MKDNEFLCMSLVRQHYMIHSLQAPVKLFHNWGMVAKYWLCYYDADVITFLSNDPVIASVAVTMQRIMAFRDISTKPMLTRDGQHTRDET